MAKISEAKIAGRMSRLELLHSAMTRAADKFLAALKSISVEAQTERDAIASAQASLVDPPRQLPLAIDAGPPVVMAPAPWKPTRLALSILRRIYGTPAAGVPFVGASERRGLWALREHGLVHQGAMRPGAESLTEAGLALVLAELAKS